MNFYVYFASLSLTSYQLSGFALQKAKNLILKIKDSPLPLKKQELLITKLVEALHQENKESLPDEKKVLSKITKALNEALEDQKKSSNFLSRWAVYHPQIVRNLDIFLFMPLWIGLYQALVNEILEYHSLSVVMPFGFSNLLQALGGYIAVKLTLEVMLRFREGWKRWLSFIGIFIGYLLWMKLSSCILGAVHIQAISVILISVLIFLTTLTLILQIFGKPIKS